MREMIKPAIAKPRGFLKMPINENRKPKIQTTMPMPPTPHNRIDTKEQINPMTPIVFDLLFSRTMIVVGCWGA